ncbi:hypothetical protein GJ496_000378 [Pomphorhynchus laevis]|nr:hypothetical protein GJ496_000378 [Pomphorhynchus laevis]
MSTGIRDREIRAFLASSSTVASKYRIIRKIGSGSFGVIFLGININNGEEVAIKVEHMKTRHPQLLYESKLYRILSGCLGIPRIRWFGIDRDFCVLVMDLLGPSLEDLFSFCSRKFSMKTILMIVDQMITRIEFLHQKGFIHRDIKPDNFLMGIGRHCNRVYMIDFGLAKRYKLPGTNQHIEYRENKNLTGTARYASINAHLGIEQSRRDDLESLAYVMMYFNRGVLPWQGLRAITKKQKYEKISEKKMSTTVETLCKGVPAEFAMYLNYSRGLRFEEGPDYMYLRQLFRILFRTMNYFYDYTYDWTMLKQRSANSQSISHSNLDHIGGTAAANDDSREVNNTSTSPNKIFIEKDQFTPVSTNMYYNKKPRESGNIQTAGDHSDNLKKDVNAKHHIQNHRENSGSDNEMISGASTSAAIAKKKFISPTSPHHQQQQSNVMKSLNHESFISPPATAQITKKPQDAKRGGYGAKISGESERSWPYDHSDHDVDNDNGYDADIYNR